MKAKLFQDSPLKVISPCQLLMRQKEAQYVGISTSGPSSKMALPICTVRPAAAASVSC